MNTDIEYLEKLTENPQQDCIIWNRNTYATMPVAKLDNGQPILAARFAYKRRKGSIPKGKIVKTICTNPRCVNPDHLAPATPAYWVNEASCEVFGKPTEVPTEKRPRLSESQVKKVVAKLKQGVSIGVIRKIMNVPRPTIDKINKGLDYVEESGVSEFPIKKAYTSMTEDQIIGIGMALIEGWAYHKIVSHFQVNSGGIARINYGEIGAELTGASLDNPLSVRSRKYGQNRQSMLE